MAGVKKERTPTYESPNDPKFDTNLGDTLQVVFGDANLGTDTCCQLSHPTATGPEEMAQKWQPPPCNQELLIKRGLTTSC